MKNVLIFCLFAFLLLTAACKKVIERDAQYPGLKKDFAEPPLDARPKGMWCWVNGNFGYEGITHEIREVSEHGMGGLDIWDAPPVTDFNNVVPTGPGYPSDEFMQGVKHASEQALKYNINLGFIWNQSVSYRDPENEIKVLESNETIVTGPGRKTIRLSVPEIRYGRRKPKRPPMVERDKAGNRIYFWDVGVLAFPVEEDPRLVDSRKVADLTEKLEDNGDIRWDVPQGKWRVVRYTCIHSGQNGLTPSPATRKPALDMLDPDATEIHLKYLLDFMEKHMGDLGETALQYLCSDSYEFRGHKWTVEFPRFFRERYGYDIRPFLPAIFGYTVGTPDSTRRFLADYNNLVSDLTIENHYHKCVEVANSYGTGFISEAAGPGYPVHNVPFESLRASGHLTYPRGEFWHYPAGETENTREHLQIIKGPASAAHIYDQEIVEAESFTSVWLWQEGPGDYKHTVDRLFTEGLNRIAFHTFPHTPERAGKPGYVYGFGTQISETLPWWPKSKPFMDYLGRSGHMLRQGEFVADYLYFYGDTAPNFVPSMVLDPLNPEGHDYDYINSEVLINSLQVSGNRLVIPRGPTYELLVLPGKDAMEPGTLEKVEQLVREGAWILGPKPRRGYSLGYKQLDEDIREIADRMWQDCDGKSVQRVSYGNGRIFWNVPLTDVLKEKGVKPDFISGSGQKAPDVRYIHRRSGNTDIYFVSNQSNREIYIDPLFRVTGKQPEIWDPVSGRSFVSPLYSEEDGYTRVPLVFPPSGSVFVVFAGSGRDAHYTELLKDGEPVFPSGGETGVCFRFSHRGEILFLDQGKYTLKRGRREEVTEFDGIRQTLDLNTGWEVSFTDPWDKTFHAGLDKLKSWTEYGDDRIRFFSGMATYVKNFELPAESLQTGGRVELVFDGLGEIAEFYLNQRDMGIVWTRPYRVDITEAVIEGENTLKIEVVNNWANILCGEARKPEEQRRFHSNITRLPTGWKTPFEELPTEEEPLPESGIRGLSVEIY